MHTKAARNIKQTETDYTLYHMDCVMWYIVQYLETRILK